METVVKIEGRSMWVEVSETAVRMLEDRTKPLVAEMELYFSCLIRKRVRFREGDEGEQVRHVNGLYVTFRPVMTRRCSMAENRDAPPPLTDFPMARIQSFVPRWLRVDYQEGAWLGEFGF